jgi:hypothetical protein
MDTTALCTWTHNNDYSLKISRVNLLVDFLTPHYLFQIQQKVDPTFASPVCTAKCGAGYHAVLQH